jgi:hypothetical protein
MYSEIITNSLLHLYNTHLTTFCNNCLFLSTHETAINLYFSTTFPKFSWAKMNFSSPNLFFNIRLLFYTIFVSCLLIDSYWMCFSFFFLELNGLHKECKMSYFSLPSSLNTDCVTVCRKMHCNSAKKDPISFCSPCYFSWLYENLFSLSYQKMINSKDKLHKIRNLLFYVWEGKRAIRNLILKAQNIPLNDLQTLMVVNEIQAKVMRVRNDTFINPLAESSILQCQKWIVITAV